MAKVHQRLPDAVEDEEVKYGLAVTGIVDKDKILANDGAQAGDRLVLSKPLGMGAVSTSIKVGKANEADVATAIATMATLNDGGARAMREVVCNACTDITGFGLLGHAAEVARASGVILAFRADALPFTAGARDLAARGVLSGGVGRTRKFLGEHAVVGANVAKEIEDLAFDAETSGGLLMAVPADRAADLIAALERENTPCAVDIGEVRPAEGETWVSLS